MMKTLKGYEAILAKERDPGGVMLCKYQDPISGAMEGLSAEEARGVAMEDPGLIWGYTQGEGVERFGEVETMPYEGDGDYTKATVKKCGCGRTFVTWENEEKCGECLGFGYGGGKAP